MASVKAEYIGTTTARFTPDKKAISKVCETVSNRITKTVTLLFTVSCWFKEYM